MITRTWRKTMQVASTGTAVTGGVAMTLWALNKMERSYSNSKYNPGYKHQERQDRRNKRELDHAQLNVQNSINHNFNNDNDDMPPVDPNNKGKSSLFLFLYLINEICIDPNTQKPKEKVVKFLKGDTNNDTSSTPKNNVYEQKEEHSDNDKLEDNTTKYE